MKKNQIAIIVVLLALVAALAVFFSSGKGQKLEAAKGAQVVASIPPANAEAVKTGSNALDANTQTQTIQPIQAEKPAEKSISKKVPEAIAPKSRVAPAMHRDDSVRFQTIALAEPPRRRVTDAKAAEAPVEKQEPAGVKTAEGSSNTSQEIAKTDNPGIDKDVLKAKIAADIAAKRPMKDIIKESCDAGMDVGEVVGSMINAGGDAQAVVYAAISGHYRTEKVVKGAIRAKAPLDSVVTAAKNAGADGKAICRSAIEEGIFPADCASADSSSGASGAPAYGYSNPAMAPPTTMYAPVAPVVIGGGGGGGSSKKASPSKP